jgi:glycosyltransferase involved in cell wall biosynthesis
MIETQPSPDGNRPKVQPIAGLAETGDRPFWSVMIPTYNASGLLEESLRSVLDQDPGPGQMQIAVVDDCSPGGEAAQIVEKVAPGRVEFHRQPANVGLAANWNDCIDRARGHWIHVFHQDDVVLPGFYERLGRGTRERPDAGAAFCRHVIMDVDGFWESVSPIERRAPGVLEDWLSKISLHQRLQCASIVVRRDVYENLGGYRSDLKLALDWEMWVRIASRYPVWFEPGLLACWRVHYDNESRRLHREGSDIADALRAIEITRGYLPPEFRPAAGSRIRQEFRDILLKEVAERMNAGEWRSGLKLVRTVRLLDPSLRRETILGYRKWAAKLWVRERLAEWFGDRHANGTGPRPGVAGKSRRN